MTQVKVKKCLVDKLLKVPVTFHFNIYQHVRASAIGSRPNDGSSLAIIV